MKNSWESGASATPPAAPASPSVGYPTDGDPSSSVPPTYPGAYWFHQVTSEIVNAITAAGLTPSAGTLTQLTAAIQTIAAALGPVSSVYGRTGAVVAANGDYQASKVTNDSSVTGATVKDALNTLLADIPAVPVSSVFGRTGAVVKQSGDYAVADITGAAPLASPALTGAPTINGSPAIAASSFTGSNQSLASSGYQRLPGGLILQWITVSVGDIPTGGGSTGTIALPTTFPSSNLVSLAGLADASSSPAIAVFLTSKSTSSVSYRIQEWDTQTQNCSISIVAIGY